MSLQDFVSDKLVDVLGASEKHIEDFIVAAAASAKSAQALTSNLTAVGLPAGHATSDFATQLFQRIPRKESKAEKDALERKRAAAEISKQYAKQYKFEPIEKSEAAPIRSHTSSLRDKEDSHRKSRKRRRRDDEDRWEEDEVYSPSQSPELRRSASRSPEDDRTREERERKRDQEERRALDERLKTRELADTKKKVGDHATKDFEEIFARRQLADDAAMRQAATPELRERARQEYLKKRLPQQIALLKQKIRIEEEILGEADDVTPSELRDLQQMKDTLATYEETQKIDTGEGGYQLPADYITEKGKIDRARKESALYARYQSGRDDAKRANELETWEASQTRKAVSKSAYKRTDFKEDEYEYVFDNDQHIDFVVDVKEPGSHPIQELLSAKKLKAQSMKELRESLPMFKYREELLAAIEEYHAATSIFA